METDKLFDPRIKCQVPIYGVAADSHVAFSCFVLLPHAQACEFILLFRFDPVQFIFLNSRFTVPT